VTLDGWCETTLGEVCDQVGGIIQTGPFGSQLHESDYSTEGVPVVMPKDIIEGRIDAESVARVSPEHVERLSRHKLRRGDIVYGRRGDIGRQALIRPEQEGWMCGTGCLRLSFGESVLNPLFLHYYLRQDDVVSWITNQAVGATMPNLNTGILRTVPVRFPPLPVQRRIAGILSAYDELIENNQRRIRVLEAMARALYREWFVKFRFPGHEKVPRVASPLGDVPQGWLLPLADHVDFKEGPGLRNWQYRSEGIPFLNIRTLIDNDIDLSKVQFLDPKEVENKYQHFLLREHDHVVSSSGTIGRIVTIRAEHLPLMLNTSIIRMRPQGKRMGCWQLKHFMLSDYFQNQAKSFATGAAQPNFGPIHLNQMKIIAPSERITEEYERLAAPVELSILSLARKIQNLRQTRDLLLPRLLSGQLELTTQRGN
jgi:type I restriction enzyme, S subunit